MARSGIRSGPRGTPLVSGDASRYGLEQTYTDRLLTFDDSAEARRAFFDKREPEWSWR